MLTKNLFLNLKLETKFKWYIIKPMRGCVHLCELDIYAVAMVYQDNNSKPPAVDHYASTDNSKAIKGLTMKI